MARVRVSDDATNASSRTPTRASSRTRERELELGANAQSLERTTGASESSDAGDDGLTAFERERVTRIARNKARMEALNIKTLREASELGARANEKNRPAPSARGIAKKRVREREDVISTVLRRSSRARNIAPELAHGVERERRDGTVVLADGATYHRSGELTAAPSRARRGGELPMKSENGDERADAAFIEMLKTSMGKYAKTPAKPATASVDDMVRNKLKLRESDVAKCTPKGVTHLDFSPDDSMLLLAAGDKEGHVCLWRVDGARSTSSSSSIKTEIKTEHRDDDDDDDVGDDDGVLYYKAHGGYISHCKWGRGALRGKLLTSAYDGAVRVLDPERGVFQETVYSDEDEFSACDQFSHGNAALVCDNVGNLHQLDLRTGKFTAPSLNIHEKKINTVHVDPGNENMFATSTHQLVSVWDVRKLAKNAKAVHDLPHSKSSQAAYWNPSGDGALLTTCYDDALRVWHPYSSTASEVLKIKHNNQTGRWVLPFRAIWSSRGDGILCGSMNREVEIFHPRTGASRLKVSSELFMTAIGSRLCAHRSLNYVAAGTASGRAHVFRA